MIEEKDYEKFKEMYDYKRKVEYNKEKIKKRIDKMYEEFEFNISIFPSRLRSELTARSIFSGVFSDSLNMTICLTIYFSPKAI